MRFHSFSDMCYPIPDGQMRDLNWKLRYGGELTESERVSAASVLTAYAALTSAPISKRNKVFSQLRGKLRVAKLEGEG